MAYGYLILAAALTLIASGSRSSAMDSSMLTPRIGETVQEFEARKRGIKLAPSPRDVVTITADRNGHFYVASILNGQSVRMVVDTGASIVALTYEDAERIGARLSQKDFTVQMSTANGLVQGAPIRIDEIRIAEISMRDVEAVALPKGSLEVSLLGMSFLKRLSGFDISQGRLNLRH
jgi:aspartyl protease family protein